MSMTIYKSPKPDIPLFNGSIPEFILSSPHLRARPDSIVLTDAVNDRSLTAAENITLVRSLAAILRSTYAVKPGTVVAVYSPNHIYLIAIHYAILWCGGVVSPVNSAYPARDLREQLSTADARLLIAFTAVPSMGDAATEAVSTLSSCSLVPFTALCDDALANLKAGDGPAGEPVKLTKPAAETLAYLCFSSGTTGKFKGVMTSHYNLTSNVLQTINFDNRIFSPEGVYAGFLPMSHIYALTLHLYAAVYLTGRLIVFPKFELEPFLQCIVRYKMSHLHLVPPILILLAKSPLVDKYPQIREHIFYLGSGAAPLSRSLGEAVKRRLQPANVRIGQGYGMTECTPVTHYSPLEQPDEKLGTIGNLVANVEARLVDPETGKDVPRGHEGELVVRGPNIMMGYLNNEEATRATLFDGGWLRTGDIASVGDDGFWTIIDRSKELIKYKGFQVAPAELEALLLTHPKVVDAAVVGTYSESEATELARAYVVLAPGVAPLEIKQWVDGKVAKHKRLYGGIVVVNEVPKSPSGKILRRLLKERKGDVVVGMRDAATARL